MASNALGSPSLSQQPIASSSISLSRPETRTNEHERRHQAGPLPVKAPLLVGEIGYAEFHEETDLADVNLNNDSTEGLNPAEADARIGRHPADRSYVDLPAQTSQPPSSRSPSRPAAGRPTSPASDTASSMNMPIKPLKARTCLKGKIAGVSVKAILYVVLFATLLAGTIVGWVLAALHISSINSSNPTTISPIFLHLIFAVLVLVFLVFIERSTFRVRAERYAHVHPGQMLPSHRRNMPSTDPNNLAYAPWNRPSLPTYAAALGFRGTGDVEDALIAGPAPPAYGNTRGSTLLLANLMRNSRASNRVPESVQDDAASVRTLDRRISTRSLPIPYDESEHQEDARRAQTLAETLAHLEERR
ncbi:hypothetical protein M422DRAFT_24850 [Sphaerobolus stellatus SS14]|nr:hypothetical protein M422DRAFT_24850 [Sphaerobolus stellatus SS14]